jgi:hypothetical protein
MSAHDTSATHGPAYSPTCRSRAAKADLRRILWSKERQFARCEPPLSIDAKRRWASRLVSNFQPNFIGEVAGARMLRSVA